MTTSHLARLNRIRLEHDHGDPRLAGFFDALDEISALGEASPGLVGRLHGDSGAGREAFTAASSRLAV